MLLADGIYGGEAIEMPVKRRRLDDEELRSLRRSTMIRLRKAGTSVDELAKFFRLTPRRVRQELQFGGHACNARKRRNAECLP